MIEYRRLSDDQRRVLQNQLVVEHFLHSELADRVQFADTRQHQFCSCLAVADVRVVNEEVDADISRLCGRGVDERDGAHALQRQVLDGLDTNTTQTNDQNTLLDQLGCGLGACNTTGDSAETK
jgi:hypothetical protein